MKICLIIVSRILSLILIIFYILVFIYINLGIDEDYQYYSKRYKNCLKNNRTKEKGTSTSINEKEKEFPWIDKKEELQSLLHEERDRENCEDYNKYYPYFISCLIIYIYIIFNVAIKLSYLINGNNVSCQIYINGIFIILYISFIVIFTHLSEKDYVKRPKTSYIKFIILIINIFINILILILLSYSGDNQSDKDDHKNDCLDVFARINNEKRKNLFNNKISAIEKKNNLLKEENQNLIKLEEIKVSNNIEDKKFEVILWYVEKTYNEKFFLNILYKYLLEEIKNNFRKVIDKNQLEKIFLGYIKEQFEECLKCPIALSIFKNPVIAPDGQTFDKYEILKALEKNGENPLTRKKLFKEQLIDNILVKKICTILAENNYELSKNNFNKIKSHLINPENKKFYSNPVVINEGDKIGETKEGIGLITEYSNKAILNIIEQNKEILSNDFFKDINESNINHVNNLYNNDDILNTDIRLNINTNSKNI